MQEDSRTSISSIYRDSLQDLAKDFSIGVFLEKDQLVTKMWKEVVSSANQHPSQDFTLKKTNEQGESTIVESPRMREQKRMKDKHFFLVSKQDFLAARIFYTDCSCFPLLVELGPPGELRWSVWKIILLYDFKAQHTYEQMLEKQDQKHEYMIGKDTSRTLVTHKFFNAQFGQIQLHRLLKSIAILFPNLGYCQGMNFLGGFLLLVSGCDESLSFQAFSSLLINPKYLFYFIYCQDFKLLIMLSFYVKTLLIEMNPKLHHHFQEKEVDESFWLNKMLLSMFLSLFSIKESLRFWDYFIANGFIGLVELVLSILDMLTDKLLSSSFEEILYLFVG